MEAARLAGVPPWELDAQPMFWRNYIFENESIRNQVTAELRKREQRKRARQGRR